MEYAKEKMQELILCRSIMQDQIQQIKSQAENNEKNKVSKQVQESIFLF